MIGSFVVVPGNVVGEEVMPVVERGDVGERLQDLDSQVVVAGRRGVQQGQDVGHRPPHHLLVVNVQGDVGHSTKGGHLDRGVRVDHQVLEPAKAACLTQCVLK